MKTYKPSHRISCKNLQSKHLLKIELFDSRLWVTTRRLKFRIRVNRKWIKHNNEIYFNASEVRLIIGRAAFPLDLRRIVK